MEEDFEAALKQVSNKLTNSFSCPCTFFEFNISTDNISNHTTLGQIIQSLQTTNMEKLPSMSYSNPGDLSARGRDFQPYIQTLSEKNQSRSEKFNATSAPLFI